MVNTTRFKAVWACASTLVSEQSCPHGTTPTALTSALHPALGLLSRLGDQRLDPGAVLLGVPVGEVGLSVGGILLQGAVVQAQHHLVRAASMLPASAACQRQKLMPATVRATAARTASGANHHPDTPTGLLRRHPGRDLHPEPALRLSPPADVHHLQHPTQSGVATTP
ncbi:MAG: hypothetical protein M4D85_01265 [Actinomycetota bacterium]|nr:hypothetical protein [Actinomycetota bacterium]